jgi:hypothetical protein
VPWRGPEVPGEFPTLGYQIADWIEARCAIPDREMVGEPFLLTDEQLRFLLNFYRLDPLTGQFAFFRGGQLTRPQKWGKGPLAAAVICAEAQGPVLPDGWDADGEPVGKSWATPLVQVTAVSEDQTDNVYSALLPMIELGALRGEIEDTGLGRINLPGGGKIEPVTASAVSRLGQRVTFAVQDQTESWLVSNKGRKLADNQRRGLAGMGGRWLSTPNAWDPTENSVAQYTAENEIDGVYHDDVEPPDTLSIRNKAERHRALRIVYGDAIAGTRDGHRGVVRAWINPDRIDSEIVALMNRDPAQAERWFLNRKQSPEGKAFSGDKWDELASDYRPKDGALIVLAADGARFEDDLAVIATEVETGFQWPVGIWHRPENADDNYEHPMDEVDGAVSEAVDSFKVWRIYIDPGSATGNIEPLVEKWQGRWTDRHVIRWLMSRPKQTAFAVSNFTAAINTGTVSHNGDESFAEHVKNAVRWKVSALDDEGRRLYVIGKDRPGSPNKIDGAAAGVLSWEARGDAVAAGAQPSDAIRAADRSGYFL